MDETELVLRCRELNDVARSIREVLAARMEGVARDHLVYTFKNRTKSANAILSKVRRKRSEERDPNGPGRGYGPDHVTDGWGCRYVTLYQSQIPPTVKELLSDFDDYNTTKERKIELIEFVIYTNRPDKDPLSITREVLEVLPTCSISSSAEAGAVVREPENRKSAYSSVHLLFQLEIEVDHAGRGPTLERAKFEVQVRDIFEEGWGEIQHNLIYSDKDRPRVTHEGSEEFDPLWQPHLNALKTFVDGCSQHASIIKRSYDFIKLRSMPSLDTKSATSRPTDRDAIIEALKGHADTQSLGAIRLGYDLVIDAQRADSVDEARSNYLAAASKFTEAAVALRDQMERPIEGRSGRPLGYFLKIERANCLYFSKDPIRQAEAIPIYRELLAGAADDPTVRLRLGLAVAATGGTEAAISEAIGLIRQAVPLIAADPLTGPDHWIAISTHVHLGYLLWSLSNKVEGDERAALLREAIAATLTGYEAWRGMGEAMRADDIHVLSAHKALSNLLYYSAKLLPLDPTCEELARDRIERRIADLDQLKVPAYREFYKTRDNVMHALVAIGNKAAARAAARENVAELRKLAEARASRTLSATELDSYMNADEHRNYVTAATVIADVDA